MIYLNVNLKPNFHKAKKSGLIAKEDIVLDKNDITLCEVKTTFTIPLFKYYCSDFIKQCDVPFDFVKTFLPRVNLTLKV